MGSIFSYFKNIFKSPPLEKNNKNLREILKEDENFQDYLKVYSGESFSINNTKLEFDNGLFFK